MKVGDLIKLKHDEGLGIIIKHQISGWWIEWLDGSFSFHNEWYLEIV